MKARILVVVAALVGAATVALTPPPAVATTPTPPTITGTALPAPAGGTNVTTTAISCPGAGSCVAVGQYVNGTSTFGVIETLSAGSWTPTTAPLPGNALITPAASLDHVACGAIGSCVAYGTYSGTDAKTHVALLSLAGGTWSAEELSLPADANATPSVTLGGAGCDAANSCVVVGNYTGTDFLGHSFAAMFHTSWSAQTVTLPVDHVNFGTASGAVSKVNAIACSSSLCTAVGQYLVSDGTARGLAVSIDPSAGTVNSTQAPMGATIASFGNLTAVSCAASGDCAAYGTFEDSGNVFHAVFVPLTGASWSAIDVPTPTPRADGTQAIVVGLGCVSSTSGADCVAGGIYTDTSAGNPVLVDQLTSNVWGSANGTFSRVADAWACGSVSFCVGIATDASGPHNAVTTLSSGQWFEQDAADPASGGTANGTFGVSCDAATSCWTIGTTSGTNLGLAEHVTPAAPPAPPTISLTGPTSPFTLATSTKVSWTAAAAGGLAGFQVRTRKSAWNGNFGGWSVSWPSVSASARSLTASGLSRGTDYCYEARAQDSFGTWSGWTTQRCTAVPLDDRSVSADAHWSRIKGSAFWNGTATAASRSGATMSRTSAQLMRIALVVTRCPSCGRIRVYVGSAVVGTINLTASKTQHRVVIVLPAFSLRSGTIRIKVISSKHAVQVDGVGISRT